MTPRLMLTALALLTACAPDRSDQSSAAGMADMADMPGMTPAASDTQPAIQVRPREAELAGVTFAVARRAPLTRTVRAVAMAVPSERGLGQINARVAGWVERLYANETGRAVRKGEPLLELYAPDLVTAQEELLLARRLALAAGRDADEDSLVAAARRRLRLWNISGEEVAELERTGTARRTLAIRSPFSGHILEKRVIEGQMVRPGDTLFQIADLTTIWVEPAVFEQDISLVRAGQEAEVVFQAIPARAYAGRVTFIRPELDPATRTLTVRIEIPNPRLEIKPMMYGAVRIEGRGPGGVVVPLTAVLPTGARNLAFVLHGTALAPTEVVVGGRGDSTLVVARGLSVGDTVVSSATFLFDSESSLAAALKGLMLNMGMGLDMGGMRSRDSAPMPGMPMDRGAAKERRP